MKKIGKNTMAIGLIISIIALFMLFYSKGFQLRSDSAQTPMDREAMIAKADKYRSIAQVLMLVGGGLITIPLVASIFISINKD